MFYKNQYLTILFLTIIFYTGCKQDKGQEDNTIPCMQRAVFGNPDSSDYVLPYPVGTGHYLSQSYCNPSGGHKNQLAYDFAMTIGDTVCAARAGIVMEVKEDLEDTGYEQDPSLHNHIMIQHEDGTVAFYAHLKKESIFLKVSNLVEQGQVIGLSGNSGNTGGFPHLHFGVYQGWPMKEGFDVAVNFRNASGPLDKKGGLVKDELYKATPW
jgi:murein DD-endopeptidase MepM/ murein hydrolase activator NlpD